MSKSELIIALRHLNEEIRQKYKGRIIGIFGSYARGDETDQSDVDLLVEKEANVSLFVLGGVKIYP